LRYCVEVYLSHHCLEKCCGLREQSVSSMKEKSVRLRWGILLWQTIFCRRVRTSSDDRLMLWCIVHHMVSVGPLLEARLRLQSPILLAMDWHA
jgi:hypothetical protein